MASPSKNTGKGIHKNRLNWIDPMLLIEVEGLARDGYDDWQIAEILNVNHVTFSNNKRRKRTDGSPSLLSQALRRGRAPLCVLVENALLKLAMGMTIKTTIKRIITKELNEDGNWYYVETIEKIQEIPPSLDAIIFWLKHRKPEVYNVKPYRVDHTTNGKEIENFGPPKITRVEHVGLNSDCRLLAIA